jgi:DNA-binding transcriptional LysR family regulator
VFFPAGLCNDMLVLTNVMRNPDTGRRSCSAVEMDIELLERFVAVVEFGSLNKAAASLNLSQPALSRSIRQLEEKFSVELIRRSSRGIVPTSYGQALFRRAKLVNSELRKAETEIGALRNLTIGEINVGLPSGLSLMKSVLPTATLPLISGNSRLAINYITGNRQELLNQLRVGDLDFAITDIIDDVATEDLVQEELFIGRSAIFVKRRHPLLALRTVTIDDVNRYSWVTMPSSALLEEKLRKLGSDLGKPFNRGIIRSDSSLLVRSILMATDLVGLVTLDAVFIEKTRGILVEVDLEKGRHASYLPEPQSIGIIYRRDAGLSPASAKLVATIKLHCEQMGLISSTKQKRIKQKIAV